MVASYNYIHHIHTHMGWMDGDEGVAPMGCDWCVYFLLYWKVERERRGRKTPKEGREGTRFK